MKKNDYPNEEYDMEKHYEKKEQQKVELFLETSPKKDEEVCGNCGHFTLWGVHTGMCTEEDGIIDHGDREFCDKDKFIDKKKKEKLFTISDMEKAYSDGANKDKWYPTVHDDGISGFTVYSPDFKRWLSENHKI